MSAGCAGRFATRSGFDDSTAKRSSLYGCSMSPIHAASDYARLSSHGVPSARTHSRTPAHAPSRTLSPRHPAAPHTPPQALSAQQVEQGVVTLPLSLGKADRPIQIPFEVPAGKVFLVAALSGGAGGAVLSVHRADGTPLAAAERVGLDNGTYKLYALDLREAGPEGVGPLVAQIGVTPGTKGFRNVRLVIKAAGFGVAHG
jgi:hypothetical protein